LDPRIVILDEVELSDDQLRRLEGLGRLVRHTTNPTGESEVVRRLDGAEGHTRVDCPRAADFEPASGAAIDCRLGHRL
jgi:hypothetical protein